MSNFRELSKFKLWAITLCAALILIAAVGCSRSESLVGEWRSEAQGARLTVEFRRDGQFAVKATVPASTNEAMITFKGTYSVVSSNKVTLNLAVGTDTNTLPLIVHYALSGDELQLQQFGSPEEKVMKYLRVK